METLAKMQLHKRRETFEATGIIREYEEKVGKRLKRVQSRDDDLNS